MGHEIGLQCLISDIGRICLPPLREISHHSEVVIRDKVADRISQENAPLDLAASKDALNRVPDEMTAQNSKALRIRHPGELIAR